MADLKSLRQELGDVFRKAEGAIKEFELTPNRISDDANYPCEGEHDPSDLFIPAVNQLRYAGFHIIKADSLENAEDKAINLSKAINHCQRAYFDTKEAMLLEQIGVFEEFRKSFGGSPNLISTYPEYTADHSTVERIKKEITKIRKEIYVDRNDLFDQIDPHLENLREIADKVTILEPTLARQDHKDARNYCMAIVSAGLIFFGILVTAVTSIINNRTEHSTESDLKTEQFEISDSAVSVKKAENFEEESTTVVDGKIQPVSLKQEPSEIEKN